MFHNRKCINSSRFMVEMSSFNQSKGYKQKNNQIYWKKEKSLNTSCRITMSCMALHVSGVHHSHCDCPAVKKSKTIPSRYPVYRRGTMCEYLDPSDKAVGEWKGWEPSLYITDMQHSQWPVLLKTPMCLQHALFSTSERLPHSVHAVLRASPHAVFRDALDGVHRIIKSSCVVSTSRCMGQMSRGSGC